MLADAILAVNAHYNTVIDAKMMAWINLGGVAAAIYGPRAFMLRARFQEAKKNKVTKATSGPAVVGNVFEMPAPGMGMQG